MLRLTCPNCAHETKYLDERAASPHGKMCPKCDTPMRRTLSYREKKNIKLYNEMHATL